VDPASWDGWWPPLEPAFDWWVEENHDNSTTLYLRVFPFHVFSDGYTALFHRSFVFEIDTFRTRVSIVDWRAGESVVNQELGANLTLALKNDYSYRMDVVIQTTLRTGIGGVVAGLPLQTLEGLIGPATLELAWATRGIPVGDYKAVVEVKDTSGNLLDSAATDLWLGIYEAEATRLGAEPSVLQPGEWVDLDLTINNSGSVPLTGTAVLLIQHSEDLTHTLTITVPFANLKTGHSMNLPAGWDSRGFELGTYQLLGYAKFMGMTTDPLSTTLILYQQPVVRFAVSPRTGIAPLEVAIVNQTTGTYDTCLWDWGDGGSSHQCVDPSHTYTRPGVYDVRLAVTGPGGTVSNTMLRAVTVYAPVTADFDGDPVGGPAPLDVDFSFRADGDYDTCTWSFGDGGTSAFCRNVRHTYERPGSFDVSLTVSGNGGQVTDSKRAYIVVTGTYFVYLPVMMR
jgi:PKD repeat protein